MATSGKQKPQRRTANEPTWTTVREAAFECDPDAILVVDEDGVVERMNRAAVALLGRDADEAVGRDASHWFALHPSSFVQGEAIPWRPTPAPVEGFAKEAGGEILPVEIAVSEVELADGLHRIVYLRDLRNQKAWQRQLEHQSTHDALTRLPNRYHLHNRLNRAVAEASDSSQIVAFTVLGVDRLADINRTLGHAAGDELLRKLGHRLKSIVGDAGVVGRMNGDQFGMFLISHDSAVVQRSSVLLERALEKPFLLGDASIQVDGAMGMALFPDHGADADALIQCADLALTRAKEERRGLVLYRRDRDATSRWPLMLTSELRKALKQNKLSLVYQPKIAASDGRVVGVEALVRWNHPELGAVSPEEFVAVAESSGLIRPLTQYVLEEAIEQCSRWLAEGRRLGMSINISARNLTDGELLQILYERLENNAVPRDLLTLEITESVIMEDPRAALEVVSLLATMGLSISIDDFGTGYSSLAYMKKLPAGELKIDRSFVRDLDSDEENRAIVRSTVELAHDLGMKVVAEGVESAGVWDRLRAMNCDIAQGYLFCRPLPADLVMRWIESREPDPEGRTNGAGDAQANRKAGKQAAPAKEPPPEGQAPATVGSKRLA